MVSLRLSSRVLVLALGLVAVFAATASAALPGLKRYSKASANNSATKSDITANCPSGKTLLGGGAFVSANGRRQVILDKAAPQPASSTQAPTRFAVDGIEDDDGFAGNWYVKAYAVCANPVTNLRTYTKKSATDSKDKSVTAKCPSGRRLLGSGYDIGGAKGEASVETIVPITTAGVTLTGVQVNAYEDRSPGTTRNWSLTAYAICGNKPSGLKLYSKTTSATFEVEHAVTATCPSDRKVLSGGVNIFYSSDILFDPGNILVEELRPLTNLSGFFAGTAQNDKHYNAPRALTAYAICATP